jgi:hypothetical protein
LKGDSLLARSPALLYEDESDIIEVTIGVEKLNPQVTRDKATALLEELPCFARALTQVGIGLVLFVPTLYIIFAEALGIFSVDRLEQGVEVV